MGTKNYTLVRCVATAPPERDIWLNALLWAISWFQLLINIGRRVLPPSQNLARQSRQPTSPRLPFISEPTHTSDVHRASLISSQPINRGPDTGTNGSTTETPSSTPSPPDEQVALQTHSGQAGVRDTNSRQPDPNSQNPSVSPKPITRLLLYGADNEAGVFVSDMRKFAYACCRHLRSHSQVDDRVVMGDIGFEFGTFFSQTNVRIDDMLIFGVSGHGNMGNNLITFRLSTNIHISIRDIFMVTNRLPFHCTIEIFLDVCHAAVAAEQHGLYKTWPSNDINLLDGAVRPRDGPKVIIWTAAGRQGAPYFRRGKHSYMLSAICKILKTHGPNITRRELYRRVTEHLESLNQTLRRKNMPAQIPAIFSSVPDQDQVLDGCALRPLLLADASNTV